MKSRMASLVLIVLTVLMTTSCGNNTASSIPTPSSETSFRTPTGTGYLRKSNTLWILNLEGSYTDMGRQYGALLKNELGVLYNRMDAAIGAEKPGNPELIDALVLQMDPRERQLLNGMEEGSGLAWRKLEFLNASLFFMYANVGCSAFAATGNQTQSGFTIAGRNFDNPRGEFSTILRGNSILVIYNPKEQFTNGHRDNSVAAMTQIGWLYGLTNLNSKGIYLEYNNATNSIPMPALPQNYLQMLNLVGTQMDGLHQNLYAAFDSDTLEEAETRLLGKPAVATITQIADKDRIWHYERSPYDNAKKFSAGQANDTYGYDNPPNMDIFTNQFVYDLAWTNLNTALYDDYKNLGKDSGSKTFARLNNLQNLARLNAGIINAELMKTMMTTHLRTNGAGGPFIGWELANQDVTHFTSVTDVANKVIHVYPYVDAILYVDNYVAQWSAVDLNREFR